MAKDQTIILRVDGATKQRIEGAAQSLGLSLSAFLLDAAEKAVRKVETTKPATIRAGSGACPTFFRALIATARQGGGSAVERNGYVTAGYELTRHLGSLIDFEDEDEGQARLNPDQVETRSFSSKAGSSSNLGQSLSTRATGSRLMRPMKA